MLNCIKTYFNRTRTLFAQLHFRPLCTSLLYTGDKTTEIYAPILPYMDFEKRFENLSELEACLSVRKITINVAELKDLWMFYKKLESTKNVLELKKVAIADEIKLLKNMGPNEKIDNRIKALINSGKIVKDDLKSVVKNMAGVGDKVIVRALSLPNCIHRDSPEIEKVVGTFGKELTSSNTHHLESGKQLGLLDYYNPSMYYLKDSAANFELATLKYFSDHFERQGFIQFCNPDFSRSVLVEGCGVPTKDFPLVFMLENTSESELENDRLHLNGGASLFPFCAFHSKQTVDANKLPLHYVAQGRQYTPTRQVDIDGLYSVCQSSAVDVFIATCQDNDKMKAQLDITLHQIIAAYNSLDLPFQYTLTAAGNLKPWESLRYSFQIFSPFKNEYIEIGHLAFCDDFISKRIWMCYSDIESNSFLKVISGTVIRFPILLATILEQSSTTFEIPRPIEKHML